MEQQQEGKKEGKLHVTYVDKRFADTFKNPHTVILPGSDTTPFSEYIWVFGGNRCGKIVVSRWEDGKGLKVTMDGSVKEEFEVAMRYQEVLRQIKRVEGVMASSTRP